MIPQHLEVFSIFGALASRTRRQKTLLRDAWPMWPYRQTCVLKLNVLQFSWHFPLFHLYTFSCSIRVFHWGKNKEVHFHLPLPPSFFRIECHVFLSSLEFHPPQTFRKHRKFHSSFVARGVAFHVAQGLFHRGEVLVMVICWCLGKCTGIIWDIPSLENSHSYGKSTILIDINHHFQ